MDERVATRRVLIVANPKARGYAPRKIEAVRDALARATIDVECALSMARGDIEVIVAERAAKFDVIAVHGGDGTINEAVAGLRAQDQAPPAIAIIPGGTANVLAIETRAARDASQIAAAIREGRTAPLYYGLANGRPFVLMASAGLDAAVVAGTSPQLKSRIGKWAYIAAALRQKRRARTPDLIVTAGSERLQCRLAICANTARYGGNFVIAPQTSATHPGLALVAITNDSMLSLLRIGLRMMSGRGIAGAGVRVLPIDEATIAAAGPTATQIDGDPFGTTPVETRAAETPLRLIV